MEDNLKKLLNSFKTADELKAYIEAQQQSFIDISIKMRTLEEENKNLKNKIQKLESDDRKSKNSELESQNISHSELICLTEIEKLRFVTETRPLTLEETKRFEIFQKILGQIGLAKKNNDNPLKDTTNEELLKLIEGGKSNG